MQSVHHCAICSSPANCSVLIHVMFSHISDCRYSHIKQKWLHLPATPTAPPPPCRLFILFIFQQWHLQTLKWNYCTTRSLHTGFIIYVSSYSNWIKEPETGIGSSRQTSFHWLYTWHESKKIIYLFIFLLAFSHVLCNGTICCIKRTKSTDKWWILMSFPIILLS